MQHRECVIMLVETGGTGLPFGRPLTVGQTDGRLDKECRLLQGDKLIFCKIVANAEIRPVRALHLMDSARGQ